MRGRSILHLVAATLVAAITVAGQTLSQEKSLGVRLRRKERQRGLGGGSSNNEKNSSKRPRVTPPDEQSNRDDPISLETFYDLSTLGAEKKYALAQQAVELSEAAEYIDWEALRDNMTQFHFLTRPPALLLKAEKVLQERKKTITRMIILDLIPLT